MAAPNLTPEMQQQLDIQSAPGWNPKVGDTIIGVVVGISASNPGEFGTYPIVTLSTDKQGMVNVHAFHDVLLNRLLEKAPAPGERVAISYNGEKEGKTRSYHHYSVVVDRDDNSIATWSQFRPRSNETTDES